jgi:DNA-binding GntR family transcriptional regulator
VPVPKSSPDPHEEVQPSRRLLTDDVFDTLSDEIIRGQLAPGQKIHDQDLAARLGMSRATVRTALLRLADLGLVETVPNLYTRVTPIDVTRYLQTQDTARALYVFAARYGTPVMKPEHLETLQNWSGRLGGREAVDREAIFDGSALAGFFQVFLDAMDNRPLERTLTRLRPHIRRVMGQYSHLLPAAEIDASLGATVEAAVRHDADGAARALTSYYDVALAKFHDRLAEQPELGEG